MMRNFCVLTLSCDLSPKTMSWKAAYTNHRVLVGSKESTEHCNQAIKDKMTEGWSFEVQDQVIVR